MLGTIMYVSKFIMEFLPNIHIVGALTIAYTVVFRKKALIPIYVFVFLVLLFNGFSLWLFPYLYIWTVLWGITMLLPKNMSKKASCIVYPVVCLIHGLLFGILYAPAQAILFKMSFEQMLSWIAAGFTFDIVHAIGNATAGLLVIPTVETLRRFLKNKTSFGS